jgi:hypothetical protein
MTQEDIPNHNPMWPEFFPQKCPPVESYTSTATVYRLVNNNPPAQPDFRSHREMRPMKDYRHAECEACGLSVHTDRSDSERIRKRIPYFRDMLIAKGTLNPSLGKIQSTPSTMTDGKSHHTWWVPQEAEPWNVFTCV